MWVIADHQPRARRTDRLRAFRCCLHTRRPCTDAGSTAQRRSGKLLNNLHEHGKTTALVCHGTIALLSTLSDPVAFTRRPETGGEASAQDWTYAGYKFMVISNQEEELAKGLLNGGAMKFYPQTVFEKAGGVYSSNTAPWSPNVVIDRELVTGQNPGSALDVGKAILERLKAKG